MNNTLGELIDVSYAQGWKELAREVRPIIEDIGNYADGLMFEFCEEVDANCQLILELCEQIEEQLDRMERG